MATMKADVLTHAPQPEASNPGQPSVGVVTLRRRMRWGDLGLLIANTIVLPLPQSKILSLASGALEPTADSIVLNYSWS